MDNCIDFRSGFELFDILHDSGILVFDSAVVMHLLDICARKNCPKLALILPNINANNTITTISYGCTKFQHGSILDVCQAVFADNASFKNVFKSLLQKYVNRTLPYYNISAPMFATTHTNTLYLKHGFANCINDGYDYGVMDLSFEEKNSHKIAIMDVRFGNAFADAQAQTQSQVSAHAHTHFLVLLTGSSNTSLTTMQLVRSPGYWHKNLIPFILSPPEKKRVCLTIGDLEADNDSIVDLYKALQKWAPNKISGYSPELFNGEKLVAVSKLQIIAEDALDPTPDLESVVFKKDHTLLAILRKDTLTPDYMSIV